MKPGVNWVGDNTVYIMPDFVHEIGDDAHHMSMMRTVDRDEEGDFIPFTGPSHWRFVVHEFLDLNIFYPIAHWILDWVGDNRFGRALRIALGFFWGLNCNFPPRDVALYLVWTLRGCAPRAVFEKREERWVKTYPARTNGGYD